MSLTHLRIFFSLFLNHAFDTEEKRTHTAYTVRRQTVHPSHWKAKTKVETTLIKETLFADDAAVAAHSP